MLQYLQMAQPLKLPPLGFTDMPVDDQIEYVQALWDLIAAQPEKVPVPDWHDKILDERLEDYARHPNEGKSWEAFRAELEIETKPQ